MYKDQYRARTYVSSYHLVRQPIARYWFQRIFGSRGQAVSEGKSNIIIQCLVMKCSFHDRTTFIYAQRPTWRVRLCTAIEQVPR